MTRLSAALLLFAAIRPMQAQSAAPQARLVVQTGHSGIIRNVAYSPDGKLVFTASEDSVIAWTRDTRKKLYEISQGSLHLRAIAFLKDGNRMALLTTGDSVLIPAGRTFFAALWDIETGGKIRDLAFPVIDACEDGSMLWVQDNAKTSSIRDATGQILASLPFGAPNNFMFTFPRMGCSADHTRVLLDAPNGGDGTAAVVWDLRKKAPVCQMGAAGVAISSMALSPDGKTLVLIPKAGREVTVASVDEQKEIRKLTGFADAPGGGANLLLSQRPGVLARVIALKFSPDGASIFTGGLDGVWRLWHTATGRLLRTSPTGIREFIGSVAFSATGPQLVLGKSSEAIETNLGATMQSHFQGVKVQQTAFTLTPDARYLFREVSVDFVDLAGLPKSPGPQPFWDLHSGQLSQWDGIPGVTARAFSTDSSRMLTGDVSGQVILWQMRGRQRLRSFSGGPQRAVTSVAISPDGKWVFAGFDEGSYFVFDAATGAMHVQGKEQNFIVGNGQFAPDSNRLVIGCIERSSLSGSTTLFDVAARKMLFSVPGGGRRQSAVFTPDGKYLLYGSEIGSVGVWDLSKGYQVRSFKGHQAFVDRIAVSPDSRFAVSAEGGRAAAHLWEIATAKEIHILRGSVESIPSSLAFLPNGRRLMVGYRDGTAEFFDADSGSLLASMFLLIENLSLLPSISWTIVAPDGRFDINRLEGQIPLHWIVSDQPTTPLPIEVFMRDYYEPRLLPRLLNGEKLPPIPNIAARNRMRPDIRFLAGAYQPGSEDLIDLDIQVNETRNTKTGQRSGAANLRLFREGRLVAIAPESGGDLSAASNGGTVVHLKGIRLPKNGRSGVSFSAYAFNSDGVKSETQYKVWSRPAVQSFEARGPTHLVDFAPPDFRYKPPEAQRGRAFLLNIGVNASAVPTLTLQYAATDARILGARLATELQQSGAWVDVSRTSLISDVRAPTGAGKAAIRSALEKLATEVRPEDLVIVSFSGHGYADETGRFYLIPSDAGKGLKSLNATPSGRLLVHEPDPASPLPDLLASSINSDELSQWLRKIDAGEMVLIIDACQSAASVSGGGFKPGPMGSRGLGQLAYDKGMAVLAAAQADSAALEDRRVGQGLLTFALAKEGLEARRADWQPKDDKITLIEWLRYGAERVPSLYEELLGGSASRVAQEPALFDFSRSFDPPISVTRRAR